MVRLIFRTAGYSVVLGGFALSFGAPFAWAAGLAFALACAREIFVRRQDRAYDRRVNSMPLQSPPWAEDSPDPRRRERSVYWLTMAGSVVLVPAISLAAGPNNAYLGVVVPLFLASARALRREDVPPVPSLESDRGYRLKSDLRPFLAAQPAEWLQQYRDSRGMGDEVRRELGQRGVLPS
ncbi:hypothetical protein EON81_06605 [bacterium]|nr:MAG: hypothetical protein EON81_06605 [bacterium]